MSEPRSSHAGPSGAGYEGDLGPRETWDLLAKESAAQLIDVRTEVEWNFVGVPDLGATGRQTILIEWQRFPAAPNPSFVREVEKALKASNYQKGAPLFFLCRSGARSRAAAIAMTAAGYGPCFNISDGFEGALDAERHRGKSAGDFGRHSVRYRGEQMPSRISHA
jgi:rhodanese-related sulfurtransferase